MSKLTPLSVTSSEFLDAPYDYYARLHDQDLLYQDKRLNAFFVGKYADVERILMNPVFTTAPLAKRAEPVMGDRILAQMEGEEHAGKRRIVIHGLHNKSYRERINMLVWKHGMALLAPYLSVGEIDLVGEFGKQFAVLMTLDMMGVPTRDHEQVAIWLSGIADFVTRIDMDEEHRAFDVECSRQLSEYLLPIIKARRDGNGVDMISRLCAASGSGQQMSNSEVLALCLNILLAATEPVDKTLGLLFKHLLDHPAQLAAVREDRSLLPNALDETLRITPPVQLIPRQPCEDVEIAGNTIPKGSLVFCLIGAANRDPSVFVDPARFDIHRKSVGAASRHLAFGAGTHVCVGAAFSLAELECTSGMILDLMPGIRYAEGFKYREVGLYTRGPASMRVAFRAHG